MANTKPRVIVVGGGLAGLSASIRIAEAGVPVDLFSMVPVKRSHSVCAQGGINAANEVARQQGYTEDTHVDETLYGGDFLQHQPPVYDLCHEAPKIIALLDRMGVPFNRTLEGNYDLRLFGGSLVKRTHFAGATTGQQLIYALDEQTRRYEAAGKVTKYEFWEFLWPVIDESGVCKGIIAQDMRTMKIRSFRADAVVMATGGCGLIYGKSTMSVMCTGGAASRCYQAGAWLGNPEMIQVHPTCIPGEDKCRARDEGRVRPRRGQRKLLGPLARRGDPRRGEDIPEEERWYWMDEKYPKYANLVSRDIATREVLFICQAGYGIGGGRMVYLDCTHLPDANKDKLRGIFEIYEKFVGDNPRDVPMKIFPGVHYSMGGLYTIYTPKPDNKGMACARRVQQHADQPARALRLRRGQLPIPRRQPPGRQRLAQLHLRRHLQRPERGQLRPRWRHSLRPRSAGRPVRRGRGPGRGQDEAIARIPGIGQSLQAPQPPGRGDDHPLHHRARRGQPQAGGWAASARCATSTSRSGCRIRACGRIRTSASPVPWATC